MSSGSSRSKESSASPQEPEPFRPDQTARAAGSSPGRDGVAVHRAFVVQLAPDCEPVTGRFCGRVHNLETTDGGNFDSVEGLVAIMGRVLERAARDRAKND